MIEFYRDRLGMSIKQSWDHPGNRGTFFWFGGQVSGTVIKVIELGAEADPGIKPVNVALSINDPDGFRLWYCQDINPK